MTQKHSFLFIILLLSAFLTNAQEKCSVRTSIGTASGIDAVDGFYFSFDIGIPLVKSLEISPTFNFFSTLPTERLNNGWNRNTGALMYSLPEGDRMHYSGNIMGSMSMLLLFKPFALSGNLKLKRRHELAFGAGLGIKSYASVRSTYESNGAHSELIALGAKSAWTIEPYFAKAFYNYHFANRFFAGVVASLDGFDGEAVALFGVQFGIRFK
ncbi:hypothetical protein GM418_25300 [Maribellus comscasis]|uniref:Outer membrane protein beta-barrel domain-containing protein n=1 Tax=Maribellus comscasis TaxID=2681766 RepID=A0A6I6K9R3_9BACT|nr:hypothetical protein [Maribellus comscasis]QGY46854.1 hypothetical protein GM418_25300 [Maribellus comscasis]